MIDLPRHYKIAIQAALDASEAILDIYSTDFVFKSKEDGSPVTLADITSSKIISSHLKKTQIPITGEEKEKTNYTVRQTWKKVWCVDPLDGTKEFLKKNGEFVINIALIENNRSVFGLIASPTQQQMIIGSHPFGAFQMSYRDALSPDKWHKLKTLSTLEAPIQIISSRSHYSGDLLKLVQNIETNYHFIKSEAMGSALKFFKLVNQQADIYPRFAPTMEWDIAAGQAIYESIGGKVIDIKTGENLTYNKESLYNPFFIAYNPSLELTLDKILG